MTAAVHRYDEEINKIEYGTTAEQRDETDLDRRRTRADDDIEDGLINFPIDRLYGRQEELSLLKALCSNEDSDPQSTSGSTSGFKSRAIFLGGISGAGKSALIKQTVQDLRMESKSFFFISGKYSISRTKPPFSAISEAMKRLIRDTVRRSSKEDLKELRKRLVSQHLWEDSDDTKVLASAIIPSMPRLFRKSGFIDDSCSFSSSRSSSTSIGYDINAIKYAFLSFVKGLSTRDSPLIFFLDDLQWADEASLALLTWILKDKSLRNFIFIGAYRTNEVTEEHQFCQLMKELTEFRGEEMPTHNIEVANLGPDAIAQFIADSLERSIEDVIALTEAVYSKTLGNIFFVKQALEELVRCNAIYYDLVFFQWQIKDISRVALEKFMSDDVVSMVKNKIYKLPLPLQKALSIAAFTRNVIDSATLLALLQAENLIVAMEDMHDLLHKAVRQGIFLQIHSIDDETTGVTYKFAHDRIQEAAMACVPRGRQRNELLQQIAKVLLEIGSEETSPWMLFVAAHHINSLPIETVDPVETAKVNLCVGKIAISKAAFTQAADLLRIGSDRLDKSTRWNEQYGLTLEILNALLEVEHAIGNEESAIAIAAEVLENAKTPPEKCCANVVTIEAKCQLYQRDYIRATSEGMVILKQNGVDVPEKPSNGDLRIENFLLRWKQGLRPLHRLITSYPPSTDDLLDTRLKLISIVMAYANNSKNYNLVCMLAYRAMRLVLNRQMITKDLPTVILYMALPGRMKEKFESCFFFAHASHEVMNRFPEEPPKTFAFVGYITVAGLSTLRITFMEAVNKFLELHKALLTNGESDDALACAMFVPYCFFNASLPLNALLEPKLLNLEELANSLHRENFVVLFTLFRQVLYNLQGKSANPTSLTGAVFDEEKVLSGMEENVVSMTVRDVAMCRLMLATIFDDEELMEKMLDTLDAYQVFDPPLPRQHLRMSWVGLASATLQNRGSKKHAKWNDTCHRFFRKLSSAGSPNGQVVAACLIALRKKTKALFDRAIDVCSGANNFCFVGMMNERCAEFLSPESGKKQEYLQNAYWAYQDWGAVAKVRQLEERHEFLRDVIREHAPSQMNALMRETGMLGGPRPQESSNSTGR